MREPWGVVGSPSGHRHMNSRNSRIITPSDRGTMAASRSSTGEGGTTAGWLAATGWVGIDASVDPSWEDGSPVKGGFGGGGLHGCLHERDVLIPVVAP